RSSTKPPESLFHFSRELPAADWFWPDPGSKLYWVSISAIYTAASAPPNPFGWMTRPRDLQSTAPDDAIRITSPTAPKIGNVAQAGTPIFYPTIENSWDTSFRLHTQEFKLDFGDAPESALVPGYPTRLLNNGARHLVSANLHLGPLVDAEPDGLPHPSAQGDDIDNSDDEDGVSIAAALIPGQWAAVS